MPMLVNLLLCCAIGTIFMPMLVNLLSCFAMRTICMFMLMYLLLCCALGNNIYAFVGAHIVFFDANYCLVWQMSSDSDSDDDNSYETMRDLVMHHQHNMDMLSAGAAVILESIVEVG